MPIRSSKDHDFDRVAWRVVEQANGEASALPTDTAMAGSRCHEPRAATQTQAAHCGDADSAAPVLSIWTFCPHGRGPASARPLLAGRTRLPMQSEEHTSELQSLR